MPVFEILMIVCFGIAWPINLVNSLRSHSTRGKNLLFESLIVLAYVFGIIHKLFYSRDVAIWFYLFNACMVTADLIVYFFNRRQEIRQGLIGGYAQVLK